MPAMVATIGLISLTIHKAQTAAPIGKAPSAERSAMSKIRKVINTPIAIIDQSNPCEIPDKIISNIQYLSDYLLFLILETSIPSSFAISSLTTTFRF